MSTVKEPNYFAKRRTIFHKSYNWYRELFPPAEVWGESSTAYTKYPFVSGVPKRIFKKAPTARLVFLARNPIDRTLSHVTHDMLEGLIEAVPFADGYVRQKSNNPYVDFSRYGLQVEQYLKYFERDQLLILDFEELTRDPKESLKMVFEHVGMSQEVNDSVFIEKRNVSADRKAIVNRQEYKRTSKAEGKEAAEELRIEIERPKLSAEAREDLLVELEPDIQRFEEIAGRKFNWG